MTTAERDVDRWVRSIAGHGFSTRFDAPAAVAVANAGVADARVRGERLSGMVLRAWRDGAIELSGVQQETFARTHRQDMEHVLRVERTALDVSAALARHGLRPVFLKGVALANTTYRDSELRPFVDVDVLFAPTEFVPAIETLRRDGAVRELPEVRPGFDHRFAKDIPLLIDGITVDLHRTLIRGPFGQRIPTAELVDDSRRVALGGQTIAVLEAADAYVLAALTAGAADVPARLVTLRDLLELERATDYDTDRVLGAMRRWRVEAAVARAVRLLDEQLRPDVAPALLGWAEAHRPPAVERMFMACYTSSARSYRSTLATLAAVPRWSDRLAFAHALLVPQREYRQARGWSLADHARRGIAKLRA